MCGRRPGTAAPVLVPVVLALAVEVSDVSPLTVQDDDSSESGGDEGVSEVRTPVARGL